MEPYNLGVSLMFDDFEENVEPVKEKPSGSYNASSSYGGRDFTKKEDVLQEPYIPIAIFVAKEDSDELKYKVYELISKFLLKKLTVRLYCEDKAFVQKCRSLTDKNLEVYIAWKNFNEIESKHSWNTLTSKDIAAKNTPGWEKLPDVVKSILAAQVRMLFGDKNNSVALCCVVNTTDGVTKTHEVTKDTGKAAFIIKTANRYGFPVVNLGKANSLAILERSFNI